MRIKGIGSSPGITMGEVFILKDPIFTIPTGKCKNIEQEMKLLNHAIMVASEDISDIKSNTLDTLGDKNAEVFDAHIQIAKDPMILNEVQELVTSKKMNVIQAYYDVTRAYIKKFKNMKNLYMRSRAIDIKDVSEKVLAKLLNVELNDPAKITTEVILCANEFTPTDTAQLNSKLVKGFVSSQGSKTSHSAIMARALKVPSVVAVKKLLDYVNNKDMLIINGIEGYVVINPSKSEIIYHEKLLQEYREKMALHDQFKSKECITIDGCRVDIAANISHEEDMDGALENGVDGIGLYRTEFLYMKQRRLPTELEQYRAYRKILEQMPAKKVVIRTLDIGGDKTLKYLPVDVDMSSPLGYRGLRLSLDNIPLFRTQLRALLRASMYGNLHIMFPMVSTISELRSAKALLHEFEEELREEGVPVSSHYKIGVMIEVPAAAVNAQQFAKEVDFFSIGTNDLIQYLFAADRSNRRVTHLYQPLNPSLLRLIKEVIDAAHKEGILVSVCGEMAGDTFVAPVLLGLGLDEFSMNVSNVLEIRHLLSTLSKESMVTLAEKAISLSTETEVKALLDKYLWQ